MKYTVLLNMEYCSGVFKTEQEAKDYANLLTKKILSLSDDEVASYDSDDWWQQRDNANIRPVEWCEEEPH